MKFPCLVDLQQQTKCNLTSISHLLCVVPTKLQFCYRSCEIMFDNLNLPAMGLLYLRYFGEHLFPRQARFCDKLGQRLPPGEGCCTTNLERDWTPLPQFRSHDDQVDQLETSQFTTMKNKNRMKRLLMSELGLSVRGIIYWMRLTIKAQCYKAKISCIKIQCLVVLAKRFGICMFYRELIFDRES